MLPNSVRVFDGVVTVWYQVLDELLVCDDSGLLESIHAFDDLNLDKSLVIDNIKKTVIIDE